MPSKNYVYDICISNYFNLISTGEQLCIIIPAFNVSMKVIPMKNLATMRQLNCGLLHHKKNSFMICLATLTHKRDVIRQTS